MMKYISTRSNKMEISGAEAIIQGIAADGGLYVPKEIPKLPFKPGEMIKADYREVAKGIIGLYFDDFTEEEIEFCVNNAYDEKFDVDSVVPVVKAKEAYFLELYHGKTAAFKDMALSILPYLLTTAMKKKKEDKKICILTATSGDTGKAALEGFANVSGTEIIVFYPKEGVSKIQERQMITQEGDNTHVFSIKGNFDDAQSGVKRIFNNLEFQEKLLQRNCKLSSANSINIGRLVPQIVYYVYGYISLIKQGVIEDGVKVNVVVPTGNFGNILAAYYAKQMGLPIGKFICASNENKVLTDFINTGIYDINRDFYVTNSPSMDILISSNLERLLFHLSGSNSEEISYLMECLEKDKRYEVSEDIKSGLEEFYGDFTDVDCTNETIRSMYVQNSYLMDTHTAVAYNVYQKYLSNSKDISPTIIASTASAYKFAESVAKSIGISETEREFEYMDKIWSETNVEIPKGLQHLDTKKVIHSRCIETKDMESVIFESLM